MPFPLYKWHHKRQLIYVPPKKQSTKNNCRLYNNLVGIILEAHEIAFRPHEVENKKSGECPLVDSGELSQFQRKVNSVVKKGSQATG